MFDLTILTAVKEDPRIFLLIENLRKCVESKKVRHIIIVNGSSRKFLEKLKTSVPKNSSVLNLSKPNLARALNFGVKKVKTKYFIILDSDCTITEQSLIRIEKTLKKYPILSFKVEFSGSTLFSKLIATMRANAYKNPKGRFYAPGLAMLVGVYLKIGKFDEISPSTYDTDYSFRANKLNFKIYYEPRATVYHDCDAPVLKELKTWFRYGQGKFSRFEKGYYGDKRICTFLRMFVSNRSYNIKKGFIYNSFVTLFIAIRNFGIIYAAWNSLNSNLQNK